MKRLKKLSVVLLIISSLFMTGCDATKVLEVIGKVAQGVQQAMPAIQSVVSTFSSIFGNKNDDGATAPATVGTQQVVDANTNNQANVAIIDPNVENVLNNWQTAANGQVESPEDIEDIIKGCQFTTPYDEVGTPSTIAEAAVIKNKYGITILDGKSWQDEWIIASAAKWTSQEAARLAAILEKLPTGFRNCTKGFTVQANMRDVGEDDGPSGLGGDPIMLSNESWGSKGWVSMEELVVHEMTHQFQAKNPDALRQWAAKFWPNNRLLRSSISDYGNTDPGEDMAECVAIFFTNPEKMRQHDPERYEFIRQIIWK